MTFATLPPEVRAIAEEILTDKQREAFELHLAGLGAGRIARRLCVTKTAIVSRLEAVDVKLAKAGVRQDAFGNWYREEAA